MATPAVSLLYYAASFEHEQREGEVTIQDVTNKTGP
jgi:hypothetical protein